MPRRNKIPQPSCWRANDTTFPSFKSCWRQVVTCGFEIREDERHGILPNDAKMFHSCNCWTPMFKLHLMQLESRKVRNLEIIKMWTLLQQERAHVALMHDQHVSIHDILHSNLLIPKGSKSALIRTMTLPVPLVELIASFLPLSRLWQQRIALIVKQCTVDPNAAIAASLEIIDDVLDEGGFVDACDAARVTPPLNCSSWVRSLLLLCIVVVSKFIYSLSSNELVELCCCSANGKPGDVRSRIKVRRLLLL